MQKIILTLLVVTFSFSQSDPCSIPDGKVPGVPYSNDYPQDAKACDASLPAPMFLCNASSSKHIVYHFGEDMGNNACEVFYTMTVIPFINNPCDENSTYNPSTGGCDSNPLPLECPANEIDFNGNCTTCPPNSHKVDAITCVCDRGEPNPEEGGACPLPCGPNEYVNPDNGSCDQCNCNPSDTCIPADNTNGYICNSPCPNHLVCDGWIQVDGASTWINTYDVVDCHGVNYGTRVKEESFPCTHDQTYPDNNDTDPNNNDNNNNNNNGGGGDDNNNTDPNNCDHHADPFFGFCFSGFVNSDFGCEQTESLSNCNAGKFACYKECSTDNNNTNNNTGGGGGDNNNSSSGGTENNNTAGGGSPSDSNGTSQSDVNISIDTSSMEKKLDDIASSLGRDGQLNKSLGDLGSLINNTNNNLGEKLDGIEQAIKDKNATVDMGETNGILKDINASLNRGLTENETKEYSDSISNADRIFKDALSSFETTGNDIRALASGLNPPHVSASGSCTMQISTVHIGSFTFDFNMVSNLRAPLQFFLNLYLLIFSLRMYTVIARDITKYFVGGL